MVSHPFRHKIFFLNRRPEQFWVFANQGSRVWNAQWSNHIKSHAEELYPWTGVTHPSDVWQGAGVKDQPLTDVAEHVVAIHPWHANVQFLPILTAVLSLNLTCPTNTLTFSSCPSVITLQRHVTVADFVSVHPSDLHYISLSSFSPLPVLPLIIDFLLNLPSPTSPFLVSNLSFTLMGT